MFFKPVKAIEPNEDLYSGNTLLILNEDPLSLDRLLSFSNKEMKSKKTGILIWETVLNKINIDTTNQTFHIFQYRTFKGVIKFLKLLLDLRGKYQTVCIPYHSKDEPFTTQMGLELVSVALRPTYIIGLHPAGVKYYYVRPNLFWLLINFLFFSLKAMMAVFFALFLSIFILLIAIVTRPFIYRKASTN